MDYQEMQEKMLASPLFKILEKKLLAIGGTRLVPMPDRDLETLVETGEHQVGFRVQKHRGLSSRCHGNSAKLWLRRQHRGFRIATGYALTDDGLWRQHSWGVEGKVLFETTVTRTAYFGVYLSPPDSVEFAACNFDYEYDPIRMVHQLWKRNPQLCNAFLAEACEQYPHIFGRIPHPCLTPPPSRSSNPA